MARPLQDGSRAEPTAAVSGSPACPVGGALALPPPLCRAPLASPPRLNGLCRCGIGHETLRMRSGATRVAKETGNGPLPPLLGLLLPSPPGRPHRRCLPPAGDPPAAAPRPEEPPVQPRSPAPGLERAIGARLRVLGDQFQREYAHREQRRPQGALWGHVSHFVFQLLGILYNLPAEGLAGLRPN
ncbi:formin-2-like [Podarcis raffonei]|uniref:formin-2-like n=1 Tax=Podarcis raffonei TaxID=65483 RepID=UPI0023292F56|nr:formin-2-like [Podarcis raffonei]